MRVAIKPGLLSGAIPAVPSKSAAHRQLICAALADKPTLLKMRGELSDDVLATVNGLRALGADIRAEDGRIYVRPIGELPSNIANIDCFESGSTLRFMLPLAAALGVSARFTGRGRLPARPNDILIDLVNSHGASVSGNALPLTISGRLHGGDFSLSGGVSSQYATGLLLSLPLTGQQSEITFTTRIESRPYIDLTISTLTGYGVSAEWRGEHRITIPGGQSYTSPGEAEIEGDWSNAAFWLAANALGGSIEVSGLSPESVQGDRAITDILSRLSSSGGLAGQNIDVSKIPDLAPILAVVATQAEGWTRLTNAARLRIKESDRIEAICRGLKALGADIIPAPDSILISGPTPLKGGQVDSFSDHRIAMAMAIAACAAEGEVIIESAEAVAKSYPGFWEDYRWLGGNIDVQYIR